MSGGNPGMMGNNMGGNNMGGNNMGGNHMNSGMGLNNLQQPMLSKGGMSPRSSGLGLGLNKGGLSPRSQGLSL
jgi:hypothetical protein